jgi:hypothetical protein
VKKARRINGSAPAGGAPVTLVTVCDNPAAGRPQAAGGQAALGAASSRDRNSGMSGFEPHMQNEEAANGNWRGR